MRREVRKQLLADYAVALVAERESWGRLREPGLGEAERCRTLAEWKQIAAGLRTLARQLRDAPAVSIDLSAQATEPSRADAPASAAAADEWELEVAAATQPPPAALVTRVGALRRPLHVHCLAAGVRFATALRTKLETAVPRLGSL